MENNYIIEIIKILVPVAAIVISTISLLKTNLNTKRQIRIGKLEETIECLQFFIHHYNKLLKIYELQVIYKLAPGDFEDLKLETVKDQYHKSVEQFKKIVDMEKFQEVTSKLSVLANSYLPDTEVKFKVLSIVALVTNLANCTIYNNFESSRLVFTKYPKTLDFMMYIDEINEDILKEMKLGYKGARIEKLYEYRIKFMKDLKIE